MALRTIGQLVAKEFISLWRDRALLVFVLYSFSLAIYAEATGASHDLSRASVAVVDEDRSPLSRAILSALLPPRFQVPQEIAPGEIDAAMDSARYTFVLDIPPRFQADVIAGRSPRIQLLIDATAIMQAGLGAGYIQAIVEREAGRYASRSESVASPPVALQTRFAFNQGLDSTWFLGTMGLINNITMLAVLLAGAALLREREHGTLEHLMVLPVRPVEIMLGKLLANGAIILVLTALSLWGVMEGVLGMRIAGSVPLFLFGTGLYLFFATGLGLFLGTVAGTMPRLGLLFILIVLPMTMLSGGQTPVESMPHWLQRIVWLSPSTQFVSLAQAILYRGAGFDLVWPRLLATAATGALFFAVSLSRFRHFLARQ